MFCDFDSVVICDNKMRRMKMNIDPDLGDLEEMLAHVQTQLEYEIDLEKDKDKMPSLTSVQESPKMVKRNSSFNKADTFAYRPKNRPPLIMNDEYASNGYEISEYQQPIISRGSQTSLKSDEVGSQCSLQSFRSEPCARLSMASLPEKRGSNASLNSRSRTATLPRGYGSTKKQEEPKKAWEDYWSQ